MTRLRRWPYTFALSLSLLVGAVAVASSLYLDLPLKDPDGFLGPSYIRLPLLALGFVGGGLIVEAVRRSGWRNLPAAVVEVAKTEWNRHRVLCIGAGQIGRASCRESVGVGQTDERPGPKQTVDAGPGGETG